MKVEDIYQAHTNRNFEKKVCVCVCVRVCVVSRLFLANACTYISLILDLPMLTCNLYLIFIFFHSFFKGTGYNPMTFVKQAGLDQFQQFSQSKYLLVNVESYMFDAIYHINIIYNSYMQTCCSLRLCT